MGDATLPLFAPKTEVLINGNGSRVEIIRDWHRDESLLKTMLASPLPQPEEYKAPGPSTQVVRTLRLSCAFGPPGLKYRYAGQLRVAHPWPPTFMFLLPRVCMAVGEQFNFALCNVYPHGRAQLGWHSDKEDDLVPGAAIASLSLGAARGFQFRRMGSQRTELSLHLGHGDLLVMRGNTQRDWEHRVPRQPQFGDPRVNFTFRRVHT